MQNLHINLLALQIMTVARTFLANLSIIAAVVLTFLLLTNHPISLVKIKGVAHPSLQHSLSQTLSTINFSSYLQVNLISIKRHLQRISWVHQAVVSKHWPSMVVVKIIPKTATSTWNQYWAFDQNGRVFYPEVPLHNLPSIIGPVDKAMVAKDYFNEIQTILEQKQLSLSCLYLDNREAIDLKLTNGVLIKLGSKEKSTILKRFIDNYDEISRKHGTIRNLMVDLRYRNGFALKTEP